MRYNGVIQRKLALLDKQVQRLQESLKGISCDEFSQSWEKRSMTERALQVAVEIIIDVAERIIALDGAGPVATAAEAIQSLERLGVLKSQNPYVDMVRFRNLIVYQYEEIDPGLLFNLATERLDDFRKFRDEIDQGE
ncbi:MAG: DUF86 domain-containing protein [Deltaproteobacteria bacterium]|nr:DUF86 domain-containing protein [Deltaproteobacteria bacterium]